MMNVPPRGKIPPNCYFLLVDYKMTPTDAKSQNARRPSIIAAISSFLDSSPSSAHPVFIRLVSRPYVCPLLIGAGREIRCVTNGHVLLNRFKMKIL